MIKSSVETSDGGYLKTDKKLMTSIPGMFAAGDVRDTDLYQVLTGCADGARCVLNAAEFIKGPTVRADFFWSDPNIDIADYARWCVD